MEGFVAYKSGLLPGPGPTIEDQLSASRPLLVNRECSCGIVPGPCTPYRAAHEPARRLSGAYVQTRSARAFALAEPPRPRTRSQRQEKGSEGYDFRAATTTLSAPKVFVIRFVLSEDDFAK